MNFLPFDAPRYTKAAAQNFLPRIKIKKIISKLKFIEASFEIPSEAGKAINTAFLSSPPPQVRSSQQQLILIVYASIADCLRLC
jgi:hypothetical protein